MPAKASKKRTSNVVVDKEKTTASVAAEKASKKPKKEIEEASSSLNHNEAITTLLDEVAKNEMKLGNKFKATIYWKAIRSIKAHPTKLTSGKEASKLPGVGSKIAMKIDEILSTGKLERLERDGTNEDLKAINDISRIPGITAQRAQELVTKYNIRNLPQLQLQEDILTESERKAIKYVDDFELDISSQESQEIDALIRSIASAIDDSLIAAVTGPCRLGQQTKTVDFLVTTQNVPKSKVKQLFERFISAMLESGHVADEITRTSGKFECAWINQISKEEIHSPQDSESSTANMGAEMSHPRTPPPTPEVLPKKKKTPSMMFVIPTIDQLESQIDDGVSQESKPALKKESTVSTLSSTFETRSSKLTSSMFEKKEKTEKRTNRNSRAFHLILKCVSPDKFPFALLFSTGPPAYLNLVKQSAEELGFNLTDSGISSKHAISKSDASDDETEKPDTVIPKLTSEKEIIEFVGMEYVDPDIRLAIVS